MEAFTQFLRTEFSEENIEFWLACEEYKAIDSETKLLSTAKCIYTVFIEADAPKEVRQHGGPRGFRTLFVAAAHKKYSINRDNMQQQPIKQKKKGNKALGQLRRTPPAAV